MGFCLFNSIAVAARHALTRSGIERVLIVDWDVHHGNGTQDIFYDDSSAFFLSMHQHPFYPGTGMADERGRGEGEGATLNLPMSAGLAPERYVETLLDGLDRTLARFAPDLTLISAGFDAGAEDPLGGFTLTEADFTTLAHEVLGRTRGDGAEPRGLLPRGRLQSRRTGTKRRLPSDGPPRRHGLTRYESKYGACPCPISTPPSWKPLPAS